MRTSDSIKELASALAKAQGQMEGAKKDSTNPHFKSKYADLASVVDAVKKPLADNGLSYVQFPVTNAEQAVGVETLLMHASGEFVHGEAYYLPVTKADAQGFGSALTYARRYSLMAACGLAPEDDDGNAAAAARPTVQGAARPAHDRKHTPMAETEDEFAKLSLDQQQWYRDEAKDIMDCFAKKGDLHAHIEDRRYSTEDRLFLWLLLPSDCRRAIKEAQQAARVREKETA